MSKTYFAANRGVKIVEVIRVETNEGSGDEDDPVVRVVSYFTMDGELIGHNDPVKREYRGEP